MQSAPRRRSYPRAPTIRCSSCCTSCPPPAAMLWSCSQSPLCSQVPPSTCPDSAFHTSHVLPFALSRQCLSQFPYTACRALQALPAMAPRDCFSQVQRCLLSHWHLCPVPCLLLLSTPRWRVLPYSCAPQLHAYSWLNTHWFRQYDACTCNGVIQLIHLLGCPQELRHSNSV